MIPPHFADDKRESNRNGDDFLKQPPYPYGFQDEEELYKEMLSVASATECTGLMPAAPPTDQEVDSLREIYDIPPGQRDIMLGSEKTK